MKTVHWALQNLGRRVAGLWLALAGLTIVLSFPASSFVFAVWAGILTMDAVGGGFWTLAIVAYIVGLFLAIYVWTPHVQPAVLRAAASLRSN